MEQQTLNEQRMVDMKIELRQLKNQNEQRGTGKKKHAKNKEKRAIEPKSTQKFPAMKRSGKEKQKRGRAKGRNESTEIPRAMQLQTNKPMKEQRNQCIDR